jgi:lipoprotein signal peptidase
VKRRLIRVNLRRVSLPAWALVVLVLVLVDQGSRAAMRSLLSPGERLPLVDGFVYLHYVQNWRGYAWFVPDLPAWLDGLFVAGRALIAVLAYPVYRYYIRNERESVWAGLALLGITAGVLGNLHGDWFFPYTTDFLQVFQSPSANLADLFTYAGVAALGVESLEHLRRRKHVPGSSSRRWVLRDFRRILRRIF